MSIAALQRLDALERELAALRERVAALEARDEEAKIDRDIAAEEDRSPAVRRERANGRRA